jgi:hypothetical protein
MMNRFIEFSHLKVSKTPAETKVTPKTNPNLGINATSQLQQDNPCARIFINLRPTR